MLIILFIVLYLIVAGTSYDKVKFSNPCRAIFALTIFPVFFASMFLNLWISDHLFPHLLDYFSAEHARAEELIKQGVSRRAARSNEAPIAFFVSVPLALILSAVWYWLMSKWDKRVSTVNHDKEKAVAARNLAKFQKKYVNQKK